MIQLIQERKLLPWDYIYKICANITSPNTEMKRLMRSSILIPPRPEWQEQPGPHVLS
jgi:hypothetical protein